MRFSDSHRQIVLKVAAFAIIAYGIVVLFWANLVPFLGINVFGTQVVYTEREPVYGPPLSKGDRILSIGVGPTIHTWPDYVHSLHHLNHRFRMQSEIQSIKDLVNHRPPDAQLPTGERFVRVVFETKDGEQSCWYRVEGLPWQRTALSVIWAAVQAALFGLGWLVSRRRPADAAAALFFLNCILTIGAYLGGHHWLQLASQPALAFIFAICAMALPQINLHFYLLFPTPKRWVMRHPRTVLTLIYLIPGAVQLMVMFAIGAVYSAYRHDPSAVDLVKERLTWMRYCVWTYITLGGIMFAGCIVAMIHSYRAARRPLARNQMKWVLFGAVVASVFVAYSLFLVGFDPAGVALGRATWAMFASSIAFTLSHAVALSRYRLTDADAVVQRSRLYLLISFVGSLLYYVVVFLLAFVSPQWAGFSSRPEGLLVSTSIIFVLLAANTVRTSVQKIVDRRFFREKHQLDRAMRRLGEAVDKLSTPDAVWRRMLTTAADTLNASGAAAYRLGEAGEYIRVDRTGRSDFPARIARDHPLLTALNRGELLQAGAGAMLPTHSYSLHVRRLGAEIALPILHEAEPLGLLLLGPRIEGQYTADELTFLQGFAQLSAVAVANEAAKATLERLNQDLKDKVAKLMANQQRIESLRRQAVHDESAEIVGGQAPPSGEDFGGMLGVSLPIRHLLAGVQKVAASQATVLIRGESGTGKTLLAELIHRHSPRSAGQFVSVHCASLSPGVLESELFGHVKGAFTGAHKDKIGRFQLADGGTLFLDEIGDVSLDIQTKLLRVLQEMTFEPVGSSTSRKVDVRIVAATNQSLENLMRAGRFREDLYYRLNVIGLQTPALRERLEDVLPLAQHFGRRFAEKLHKPFVGFSESAEEALLRYSWPGNVRELENVVERAAVMAESSTIELADLPNDVAMLGPSDEAGHAETGHGVVRTKRGRRPRAEEVAASANASQTLAGELVVLEKRRLLEALNAAGGNKTEAAAMLGYRRTTFCSKLKKYGIG